LVWFASAKVNPRGQRASKFQFQLVKGRMQERGGLVGPWGLGLKIGICNG